MGKQNIFCGNRNNRSLILWIKLNEVEIQQIEMFSYDEERWVPQKKEEEAHK